MKATVPTFNDADELRTILTDDSTTTPASQWRLEDLREHWRNGEPELALALLQLVEAGEIALFPVGDVTKVRIER